MHPMDLLNTMVPNLFGNHYTIGHVICWGDSYHEGREGYLVSFFLGSTTVFLSALGLMHYRRGLGRILLVLALLGVFLALGQHGYLYPWIFEHIPPLRLGRYPSKYFLLTAVAVQFMILGIKGAIELFYT